MKEQNYGQHEKGDNLFDPWMGWWLWWLWLLWMLWMLWFVVVVVCGLWLVVGGGVAVVAVVVVVVVVVRTMLYDVCLSPYTPMHALY